MFYMLLQMYIRIHLIRKLLMKVLVVQEIQLKVVTEI